MGVLPAQGGLRVSAVVRRAFRLPSVRRHAIAEPLRGVTAKRMRKRYRVRARHRLVIALAAGTLFTSACVRFCVARHRTRSAAAATPEHDVPDRRRSVDIAVACVLALCLWSVTGLVGRISELYRGDAFRVPSGAVSVVTNFPANRVGVSCGAELRGDGEHLLSCGADGDWLPVMRQRGIRPETPYLFGFLLTGDAANGLDRRQAASDVSYAQRTLVRDVALESDGARGQRGVVVVAVVTDFSPCHGVASGATGSCWVHFTSRLPTSSAARRGDDITVALPAIAAHASPTIALDGDGLIGGEPTFAGVSYWEHPPDLLLMSATPPPSRDLSWLSEDGASLKVRALLKDPHAPSAESEVAVLMLLAGAAVTVAAMAAGRLLRILTSS